MAFVALTRPRPRPPRRRPRPPRRPARTCRPGRGPWRLPRRRRRRRPQRRAAPSATVARRSTCAQINCESGAVGKEATIYICTTGQYELVGLIKLDMATERAVSGCGANARAPHIIAKHNTIFIALGLPGGRGRRRNLLIRVSKSTNVRVRVRLPFRGQGGPRAARGRYATLGRGAY